MTLAADLRARAAEARRLADELERLALVRPGAERAVMCECGRYRYVLRRDLGELAPRHDGSVVWVMLNPSTADASQDDPTVRRCIGFTRAWGYGSLAVLNLYAFRATDPRIMRAMSADVRVGPDNDAWIARVVAEGALVVAAWGAHAEWSRAREVAAIIGRPLHCLGVTGDGHPRHPLYVRADTPPVPFEVRT